MHSDKSIIHKALVCDGARDRSMNLFVKSSLKVSRPRTHFLDTFIKKNLARPYRLNPYAAYAFSLKRTKEKDGGTKNSQ